MNGELDAQRAAMTGEAPTPSGGQNRMERVLKLFTSAERARAIKAEPKVVLIGSGPEAREVVLRPLNPRNFLNAYHLLREILIPLLGTFEPNPDGTTRPVTLSGLMETLGPERIEKIPDLVYEILRRGNEISKDWIMENLDLILDVQQILPIFLEQNGLLKIGGNEPSAPTQHAPEADVTEKKGTRLTVV